MTGVYLPPAATFTEMNARIRCKILFPAQNARNERNFF
jgi:hypothetical protein